MDPVEKATTLPENSETTTPETKAPETTKALAPETTQKAPDPFDLGNLTLDQDFDQVVGIRKVRVKVPVGKPHDQAWVRVDPREDYRRNVSIIKLKAEREYFLLTKDLSIELSDECYPVTIFTYVTSRGIVGLWPCRIVGRDGKDNDWWRTEREAAAAAMKTWIRIRANMDLGGNEWETSAMTTEPKFATEFFQDLLRIGFNNGRLIGGLDHPVVKLLRGFE